MRATLRIGLLLVAASWAASAALLLSRRTASLSPAPLRAAAATAERDDSPNRSSDHGATARLSRSASSEGRPLAAPAAPPAAAPPRGRRGPVDELAAVQQAASADVDDARAAGPLITALASSDPAVVLEALQSVVERRLGAALPHVLALDVTRPLVGPSAVFAIGALGRAAGTTGAARARLVALLAEERSLRAAGTERGLLLHLYEALGELGDEDAVPVLEAELADPSVSRAAKHVVVVALGRLGSPRSLPTLLALRRSIDTPESDAFEEEVRRELVVVVEAVMARLTTP